MSTDPKATPPATPLVTHKGVKIFSYPKIIFLLPTLVVSLMCGIGMVASGNHTEDPTRTKAATAVATPADSPPVAKDTDRGAAASATIRRFSTTQNVLGMIFLFVFGLNLLIMAIDFPRFTIIAVVLGAAALGFFILWLNVYLELIPPLITFLEGIYAVANAGFYFTFATIMLFNFGLIWVTRYLDYWEILPNEILHNHGPFSDLERYPTFNLKFDKEIPDILEYLMLRSGRLVLSIPSHNRSIVMDNVLWIDSKELELKKLLSRTEVRVTTDQEAAEPI